MCTPLGGGFLVYHIYLLYIGATTNETAKWSEWKEDVEDGLVWRARLADLRNANYQPLPVEVEPRSESFEWPPVGGAGGVPRGIPGWLWKPDKKKTFRAEYWYIRTRDGEAPTTQLSGGMVVEDTRWERVRSLKEEVENIYDLGFWGNLWEVVFHREKGRGENNVLAGKGVSVE